jgi:hypothetical protein
LLIFASSTSLKTSGTIIPAKTAINAANTITSINVNPSLL